MKESQFPKEKPEGNDLPEGQVVPKTISLRELDIFDQLGRSKSREEIEEALRSCEGLIETKAAEKLILSGNEWAVKKYLGKFASLPAYIATGLIKAKVAEVVFEHKDKFSGLVFDKALAKELVTYNQEDSLAEHLDLFGPLDAAIAERLILGGRAEKVFNNPGQFPDFVADKAFADKLIAKQRGAIVAQYLSQFQGLPDEEKERQYFISRLVEQGGGRYLGHIEGYGSLNLQFGDPRSYGTIVKAVESMSVQDLREMVTRAHSIFDVLDFALTSGTNKAKILIDLALEGKEFLSSQSRIEEFLGRVGTVNDVRITERIIDELSSGNDFEFLFENYSRFSPECQVVLWDALLDEFSGNPETVLDIFSATKSGFKPRFVGKLVERNLLDLIADNIREYGQFLDEKIARTVVLFVANEDDGRLDELIDNVASIALKPLEIFKLILSTDNGPIAAVRIMDFKLTDTDLMDLQVTLGIHAKKNVLSEWLDSAKGVEGQFFEELTAVLPNPKHPWLVEKLLNPTIKVQGVAAFKTLDILGSLLHREDLIQDEKDGEMLKLVTTTQGLKAVDQLRMINEMHDKKLLKKPLSKNKHLIPFLQEFPSVTEVYKPYLAILDDETLNPREKVQAVENLKIELERQRKRIISGEATNEDVQNPTYAGLLYYTFPPATTLGREQYRALLETRVDRQKDVPQEWEVLQNKLLKFSIGAYALKEGERVDTTAWNAIARAVEEGNRTNAEGFTTKQIANLGKQLLEALTDPKKCNKNRNLLLCQIYSLHRFINGVKLSTNLSDRDNLYQLKEYASDRMRDTIDVMFQEFAKADSAGYERAAATLTSVEIDEKAKTGIVKNLLSVLRAPTLNDEKTNERLKAVLEKYDIHFEGDILGRSLEQIGELDPNDPKVDDEAEKILKDWFTSLLLKAHQERSNTNLAVEASHRLLGEDRAKMGGEMKKFEFKQNAEGGQIRILRLEVSKRRAHAVAGLNMGVCVAPDEQLWNKIDFANVILWDENNIARGGFHVETIESEGRIYLSLPGINPASSILGVVNPEELFDELIAYAKEMAKAIGAEGILIPRTGEIHSNRAEIQSVLTKKRYKKFSLTEPHRFSYKPHGYVWKDAYLIEV